MDRPRVALRDLDQIAVLSFDLSYPAGTQPQRLVFVTSFGTSDPTLVAGLEACCGGPGAVIFLLADGILLLYPFSQNFRALQSEVARHRYEQDGPAMPVASSFPLRLDPMLSSKVVCIAQLVMLGYSYGDAENALDAVRVNDTVLALEWLEARNVARSPYYKLG